MRRSLFVLLAVSAPIVAGCSGELRELPPRDENVSLDAGTPRPDPRPDPEPDPMPDPQPGCDVAIEQDVIALANQARGEAPLRCDPEMSTVARAHSADMCERDYFDHTSLDGRSPFDRMRDAGILDGDLLAVHRTPEASNGQIVVARIVLRVMLHVLTPQSITIALKQDSEFGMTADQIVEEATSMRLMRVVESSVFVYETTPILPY